MHYLSKTEAIFQLASRSPKGKITFYETTLTKAKLTKALGGQKLTVGQFLEFHVYSARKFKIVLDNFNNPS